MYANSVKNTSLDYVMICKEMSHKQNIEIAKKFKDALDEKLKPSSEMTKIHDFQSYVKPSPT